MIPKIIHFCWFSGESYPEKIQECLDSWKKFLPNYEIKLWNKDNFDLDCCKWVRQAYEKRKWAFIADYFRFWVLYNFGGIYLDSDVQVFKNFDNLLGCKSFTGYEYMGIPEAAVIGAEKGTGWLKQCLDWYTDKSFVNDDGTIQNQPVPSLIQLTWAKNYGKMFYDDGTVQKHEDLIVYPFEYFSPQSHYLINTKIYPVTYCVHRFSKSWGDKENGLKVFIHKFVHFIIIKIFGKKFHDKFVRKHYPRPTTFNGYTI